MAIYSRIGDGGSCLRVYLPEVTTTLLTLLFIGSVLRILASTQDGVCEGADENGLIGWIAALVGVILCIIEKWLRSRNICGSLVALIFIALIVVSINDAPLSCVQETITEHLPEGSVKFIPIIQTVVCVAFSFLYTIMLLSERAGVTAA